MKRKILKSVLFICSFMCLFTVFVSSAYAKDVVSGDFVFDVSGTTATVKEYKGSSKSVAIPSKVGTATVKAIGDEAFWCVKTMTSISIPSTVKAIGNAAFNECTGLRKVVIPSSVTTIGDAAFWYCTNLKTIVIPKSVTAMGINVLRGCNNLTAYVVKGTLGETYVEELSHVKLAYRYVDSVSLNKAAVTLQTGATQKLEYTVAPENVYYKKATYSSSNTKVATVASDGTVTAIAPGTATITCKAGDASGKKDTCKVTVTPQKVTGIKQTSTTKTGYTLTWAKSSGASKYRIYLYNSATKKWNTVKYTSGTSYKVTNLKPGSTQIYRILAYTSISGVYYKAPVSANFTARPTYPAKVTGITAKPAHNFINLSWSKAANASGYRVYSYNAQTKKYTFVGATTKTALKITSLSPNTAYTYMVRAYLMSGKTRVNSAYSDLVSCKTRPDYVSGLSVKENSVYVSKLTLTWNALEGVSGYRISKLEESSNSYVPFISIEGADVTSCTVDELTAGTTYSFKIQSFVKDGDDVLYGYNCKQAVTATTNSRPADEKEAFDGFIKAYNTSKNHSGDFSLIANTYISDFSGENAEDYSSVTSAIGQDSSLIMYFKDGIEAQSKTPVTSILAPKDAFCTLSFDQLKADSVSFDDDGNGFRLNFTLDEDEDGAINALISDIIDWEKIMAENEGFELSSCNYTGTKISAKVHNGLVDDITITMPVEIVIVSGENTYSFSETITKEYMFIW